MSTQAELYRAMAMKSNVVFSEFRDLVDDSVADHDRCCDDVSKDRP